MEQPRINPMNANHGTTGNQMSRNTAGRTAANTANGSSMAPGIQNSGQFGITRAAVNLALGDIIKGEISNLSGSEITITLENNTMIRGQISDSSMLSIGQKAAFRLDSITPQGVLIEPVGNYTETELSLINKALNEANLPATDYNQSAVKALMDNMMPINRESIQHLMQQAYDNKTNDMNTLALMNKLMMSVNPDSIQTFSNYRNGTEQLALQLQNYANNIPALLGALMEHGSADAAAGFGETLLQITMSGDMNNTAAPMLTINALSAEDRAALQQLLSSLPMTEETMQALENGSLSLRDALSMLRDSILQGNMQTENGTGQNALVEKLILIEQALEPAGGRTLQEMQNSFHNILTLNQTETSGEETLNNETTTNAKNAEEHTTVVEKSAEEMAADTPKGGVNSAVNLAGRLFHSFQESVNQSLNNTMHMLRNSADETLSDPALTNKQPEDLVDRLAKLYSTDASAHDLTGHVLSADARNELAGFLKKMPIHASIANKLISGEATTQEIMQAVKNALPMSDNSVLQQMFQSDSFEQLFARFLQTHWSLTPEQLQQEGQPDKLYNQLAKQMNQLEQLIGNSLSGSDSRQMQRQAHDIESNIMLMKELSENFSYMQLPLKLPNQNANSELYIYTQKNQRRMNPDKMSVLLHLDLEHLGTLEIRLDKNKQDLHANFRLDDDASVDLLRTNADILQKNLMGLGYQTNIVVSRQNENPVTMDDFLNTRIKTNATEDMKRFSFDIRA